MFLVLRHGLRYVSLRDIFAKKFTQGGVNQLYWLGYFPPWHRNAGDHAQTYAILKKLKTEFKDFEVKHCPAHQISDDYLKRLSKKIRDRDIVLVNSNGDFGDQYADNGTSMSNLRRRIARHLKNNRVIYLPSTVSYSDIEPSSCWIEEDRKLFSNVMHTLLCRESGSLEILNRIGIKAEFYPDPVLWMRDFGIEKSKVAGHKKKALVMLRPPQMESSITQATHEEIAEALSKKGYSITTSDLNYLKHPLYFNMYRKYFRNLAEDLTDFDLIVTDRMHAMIFASLCNIACIAISNAIPHKIDSYKKLLYRNTIFFSDPDSLETAVQDVTQLTMEPLPNSFLNGADFRERFVETNGS